MSRRAVIDIPRIRGWESSTGSKTVRLHRGVLKSSLPPSSDLGSQPVAGFYLAKVLLQTWDPFSHTKLHLMIMVKHQDKIYVFYSYVLDPIDSSVIRVKFREFPSYQII